MAASTVADPIGNVLQRTFHNGSFKNGNSNSSYGLMRGGSSSSINTASYLDSSLQVASKKTQIANSTIHFDPPERYVGNMDSVFKGPQTNGASNGVPKPKIIVLNPPKQGQVSLRVCNTVGIYPDTNFPSHGLNRRLISPLFRCSHVCTNIIILD